MADEIVILGGARTPMAEYNGVLRDYTEIELGAIASRAALERTGVAGKDVDHVVFGNAMQASGNAIYGARHVGLRAGLPETVPALTVNRLCGSGIQSIMLLRIRLGRVALRNVSWLESRPHAAWFEGIFNKWIYMVVFSYTLLKLRSFPFQFSGTYCRIIVFHKKKSWSTTI